MLRRGLLGAGVLAVLAAVVLALVPLHHEGVSGNALRPTYTTFGWFAYSSPLPEHPTMSQLRAAGVRTTPAAGSRQAVGQRRWIAGVLGGVGVVLVASGMLARRRTS